MEKFNVTVKIHDRDTDKIVEKSYIVYEKTKIKANSTVINRL
jgi:hypothetical protein